MSRGVRLEFTAEEIRLLILGKRLWKAGDGEQLIEIEMKSQSTAETVELVKTVRSQLMARADYESKTEF